MKYFFNIKNKVKRKLNLNSLISNKKRLSKIYMSLLKSDKINIYDIGAGHRILNELINFDQISNIYLIDPNKNLDISYKKLIKNLKVDNNVYKFFNAISDKTQTRNYYQSINSTSSTFSLNKQKQKIFKKYYPTNPVKIKTYSFSEFKKINSLKNPDIVKIDVEGHETKITNSIIKNFSPLIFQIETNVNNDIFEKSFLKIQNLLNNNEYKLYSILPVFGNFDPTLKEFIVSNNNVNFFDPEFNINKRSVSQIECYFVKKKRYSLKDLICFSAFGIIDLFYEQINSKNIKVSKKIKKKLIEIYKIQNNLKIIK